MSASASEAAHDVVPVPHVIQIVRAGADSDGVTQFEKQGASDHFFDNPGAARILSAGTGASLAPATGAPGTGASQLLRASDSNVPSATASVNSNDVGTDANASPTHSASFAPGDKPPSRRLEEDLSTHSASFAPGDKPPSRRLEERASVLGREPGRSTTQPPQRGSRQWGSLLFKSEVGQAPVPSSSARPSTLSVRGSLANLASNIVAELSYTGGAGGNDGRNDAGSAQRRDSLMPASNRRINVPKDLLGADQGIKEEEEHEVAPQLSTIKSSALERQETQARGSADTEAHRPTRKSMADKRFTAAGTESHWMTGLDINQGDKERLGRAIEDKRLRVVRQGRHTYGKCSMIRILAIREPEYREALCAIGQDRLFISQTLSAVPNRSDEIFQHCMRHMKSEIGPQGCLEEAAITPLGFLGGKRQICQYEPSAGLMIHYEIYTYMISVDGEIAKGAEADCEWRDVSQWLATVYEGEDHKNLESAADISRQGADSLAYKIPLSCARRATGLGSNIGLVQVHSSGLRIHLAPHRSNVITLVEGEPYQVDQWLRENDLVMIYGDDQDSKKEALELASSMQQELRDRSCRLMQGQQETIKRKLGRGEEHEQLCGLVAEAQVLRLCVYHWDDPDQKLILGTTHSPWYGHMSVHFTMLEEALSLIDGESLANLENLPWECALKLLSDKADICLEDLDLEATKFITPHEELEWSKKYPGLLTRYLVHEVHVFLCRPPVKWPSEYTSPRAPEAPPDLPKPSTPKAPPPSLLPTVLVQPECDEPSPPTPVVASPPELSEPPTLLSLADEVADQLIDEELQKDLEFLSDEREKTSSSADDAAALQTLAELTESQELADADVGADALAQSEVAADAFDDAEVQDKGCESNAYKKQLSTHEEEHDEERSSQGSNDDADKRDSTMSMQSEVYQDEDAGEDEVSLWDPWEKTIAYVKQARGGEDTFFWMSEDEYEKHHPPAQLERMVRRIAFSYAFCSHQTGVLERQADWVPGIFAEAAKHGHVSVFQECFSALQQRDGGPKEFCKVLERIIKSAALHFQTDAVRVLVLERLNEFCTPNDLRQMLLLAASAGDHNSVGQLLALGVSRSGVEGLSSNLHVMRVALEHNSDFSVFTEPHEPYARLAVTFLRRWARIQRGRDHRQAIIEYLEQCELPLHSAIAAAFWLGRLANSATSQVERESYILQADNFIEIVLIVLDECGGAQEARKILTLEDTPVVTSDSALRHGGGKTLMDMAIEAQMKSLIAHPFFQIVGAFKALRQRLHTVVLQRV